MRSVRVREATLAVLAGVPVWLAAAAAVSAHGYAPSEPPTIATLLFGWTF